MVDRGERVLIRLDALLDAHVALHVHVPRAGMANDITVTRTRQQRLLPEGLRQLLHAERDIEVLGHLRHLHRNGRISLVGQLGDLDRRLRLRVLGLQAREFLFAQLHERA